jgi:hypothetical protein
MDRPVGPKHRPRLINRRQQGDLGEASAVEWLTRTGATVFVPFGHSPDCDLVTEAHGRLLRIQVKTSTRRIVNGNWVVALRTSGGNRSWTGVTKLMDPSRADYVFALTGDGRRWFIPTVAIEASHSIHLGGPKYSEFEVEPGGSITELVYGPDEAATLESVAAPGEYPSGQRGGAVNAMALPSQVRILPPPFQPRLGYQESKYDRKPGRNGTAVLNQKRRVTLPRSACIEAGLEDGDRVQVRSDGDGRLIIERIEPPPARAGP